MDSNSNTIADKIIALIQEEKPSSKITFLKERNPTNSTTLLRVGVDDQKIMMKWTDEAEETLTFHAVNIEDAIADILEQEIKKATEEAEQKRREYFQKMDELNYERDNIYELLRVNQEFLNGQNGEITDVFGDEVIERSKEMFDRISALFEIEMSLADTIDRERMLDHMQAYIDGITVKDTRAAIERYVDARNKKNSTVRKDNLAELLKRSSSGNTFILPTTIVQPLSKEL